MSESFQHFFTDAAKSITYWRELSELQSEKICELQLELEFMKAANVDLLARVQELETALKIQLKI
jgi:hypothetical protein